MIWQTLRSAIQATLTRWRASLAALAIIGVPIALPFVLLQLMSGVMSSSGSETVLRQHLMWIAGHPEAMSQIFGAWLLFFAPWVIGIWGKSDGNRVHFWIGWEPYARYLVLFGCVAIIFILDRLLVGLLGAAFEVSLALEVLADCAALYVLLRLSPAGLMIRDGGALDLSGAWRTSAADVRRIIGLVVVWALLGLVISVVAEIVSHGFSRVLSFEGRGESYLQLLIVLGAPGLISGFAAAYVALVPIALFWAVAEPVPAQP